MADIQPPPGFVADTISPPPGFVPETSKPAAGQEPAGAVRSYLNGLWGHTGGPLVDAAMDAFHHPWEFVKKDALNSVTLGVSGSVDKIRSIVTPALHNWAATVDPKASLSDRAESFARAIGGPVAGSMIDEFKKKNPAGAAGGFTGDLLNAALMAAIPENGLRAPRRIPFVGPRPLAAAPEEATAAVSRTAAAGDTIPSEVPNEPTPSQGVQSGDAGKGAEVPGSARTSAPVASSTETHIRVPGDETRSYPANYEVRELGDINTSHSGLTFQPNPEYGLKNDRNYATRENQRKVVDWSTPDKFDPTYHITDNPDAVNGPPIIDSSGNTIGGNGRGMIMQRVYEYNPKGEQAYRDLLEQKAPQYGIAPETISGMKRPVLVRVIADNELEAPGAKQRAVTGFNKKGTAALTPAEQSIADSRGVSDGTLEDINARLQAHGPDATVSDILGESGGSEILNNLIKDGVISPQETAAYSRDGKLTPAGKDRISKLMLGRFFRNPEQMDSIPPSIRNKIERIAAPLARVEGLPEWNLSDATQGAVDLLEKARTHNLPIDTYLDQGGLLAKQEYTPNEISMAKALQVAKPNDLTKFARQYAQDAKFATEGGSLYEKAPTPESAFNDAFVEPVAHEPWPQPEPVAAQVEPASIAQVATVPEAGAPATAMPSVTMPTKSQPASATPQAGLTSRLASEVLGKTTGAGATAVGEALERPTPAFMSAMRGRTNEMGIFRNMQDALQNVKSERSANYRKALADLPQQTHDLTPLRTEMLKSLDEHGVKIGGDGELDFSRSTIRDSAAQNEVKGIYDDITGWGSKPGDLNTLGIDTLKRRIDDFWSPSSNARAFVQRLKSATRGIANQAPGYQKMTSEYAVTSDFLDQLKDLSLESKNPGTAIRKMTTVLNQNNEYRKVLIDALDQYSNTDLRGQVSGLAMSKWTPRGIMGPGAGLSLIGGIASGHLAPATALALAMTSPRLMGELMVAMGKVKPGVARATIVGATQVGQRRNPDLLLPSGKTLVASGPAAKPVPSEQTAEPVGARP